MNVLLFHPDPRLLAMLEGFFLGAAALAIGFAFRRAVDRYLDEGDPRRQMIAQALLYGGTFVAIALSLLSTGTGLLVAALIIVVLQYRALVLLERIADAITRLDARDRDRRKESPEATPVG